MCLYPSCSPAVMTQPNETAGTTTDHLAALNSSLQVAAAKLISYHLQNTHLWMDYIWPIWWVQTPCQSTELIPSSGNTRWTRWQRCPHGIYTKFLQYHWLPKMEPVDTCWCDHRWYYSYQEGHKILPGSLSISNGPYCVLAMPNIPIGR